ncbi:cytochrome P450 [Amylostereum chailletii]|nr:cytochrome P450 [Amylostereum chailletii]
MPHKNEWMTYKEWSKRFDSDIVYIETLGQSIVILNSVKAASDLLDKRSSIYSDRPTITALSDFVGFGWTTGLLPYGKRWRKHRKELALTLGAGASRRYEPLEMKATYRLLRNFLQTPDAFSQHLRHMAGQVTLSISYGIDIQPCDDPWIELAERCLKAFDVSTQLSGRIFDLLPFLKRMPWWFPGAGFKRNVPRFARCVADAVEKPYAATEAAVAGGHASSSVAHAIITDQNSLPASKRDTVLAKEVSANIFLAGADTTNSVLMTFMLAMVLNPDAQKKAQAEIDTVVGTARLPDFEDQESLPYVNALVKEVFRWHPVTPLGVPHRLMTDDIYDGFFIPGGAVVIANTWAILHDEVEYPDHGKFKPERFVDEKARFPDASFGFGRRVCPGQLVARSAVWMTLVSVLATFNISHAVDENGHEVEVSEQYSSGMISYPPPFRCMIKPRSEVASALIKATKEVDDV